MKRIEETPRPWLLDVELEHPAPGMAAPTTRASAATCGSRLSIRAGVQGRLERTGELACETGGLATRSMGVLRRGGRLPRSTSPLSTRRANPRGLNIPGES